MSDLHLPPPAEDSIRRRLVEEVLVSEQLRQAIEVLLQFRMRGFRWDALLAETDDVLNEVAQRALDRLATFDHRRLPLPWLMGIAINVLREHRRWQVREAAHALPQSSCSQEQWHEILDRLSTEPATASDASPVWRALGRLGPEQQRVLRLRLVEERSYSEMAQVLGVKEPAARARVSRALQTLRQAFFNHINPE
jgi:RNA polymerase sigma-70 factor (ECF subfamily)